MNMQQTTMTVPENGLTDVFPLLNDWQFVDCADMVMAPDPDFANLCAEHCHYGHQSDHAASLAVPAALLTALYLTPSRA